MGWQRAIRVSGDEAHVAQCTNRVVAAINAELFSRPIWSFAGSLASLQEDPNSIVTLCVILPNVKCLSRYFSSSVFDACLVGRSWDNDGDQKQRLFGSKPL